MERSCGDEISAIQVAPADMNRGTAYSAIGDLDKLCNIIIKLSKLLKKCGDVNRGPALGRKEV